MKEEIFDQYATAVAKMYSLSEEELFAPSKEKNIVDGRYMLMLLCKKRPMRVMRIKREFERRGLLMHHSTIVYGVKVAQSMHRKDIDFASAMKRIVA